jgi:single-stranded-DNA-specific exonuclease
VIAIDGNEGHGSCRSIPGFDMLGALDACAAHLVRYGGHKMAAGLTLDRQRIKAFREAVATVAEDRLTPDDLRPRLRVDAPLGFGAIRPELFAALSRLAPFGNSNPRPLFVARGATVTDGPRRLKERHLSMGLRHEGVVLRGLFWRAIEREPLIAGARDGLDLVYSVEQNTFNGATSLEVQLADVKASAATP